MSSVVGRLFAFLVCIAGLPFHLLICICIWISDGGAAIYRDKRVGQLEEPFSMFKYRSMKVHTKPVIHAGSKVIVEANDPRITAIGRFLRCGIDELPQIANIARGEMRWVGPRPIPVAILPKYGPLIRKRFTIQPGITGLAQVVHSRTCSSARALAIDIWYMRHHTLWLDCWIVVTTPLFICGWKSIGQSRLANLLQTPEFNELERCCQEELGPGVGLLTSSAAPNG